MRRYRVGEILVATTHALKPHRSLSANLKGLWHRQNHGLGKAQTSPPQGGPCGCPALFIAYPGRNDSRRAGWPPGEHTGSLLG
jgi:hypothetical protein